MKTNKAQIKKLKAPDFHDYLNEELKNKTFKKYFDEFGIQLELSYQILQLRKKHKMSQSDLAKKIGTTQSNVARFEGGQENFTVASLSKIAAAFDRELKISIK